MNWKGCPLPMALPLSVLVIGIWHLAVLERPPAPQPASFGLAQDPGPDYSQTPPGTYPTCQDDPAFADLLLIEGRRLGIKVQVGQPELPGKDATYRAKPGWLGPITIKQRPMSPLVRCMLISHEFIHVLQHLSADLKGVPPLGWDVSPHGIQRFGSIQEAEAYRHQNHAGHVLQLLRDTPRPRQSP